MLKWLAKFWVILTTKAYKNVGFSVSLRLFHAWEILICNLLSINAETWPYNSSTVPLLSITISNLEPSHAHSLAWICLSFNRLIPMIEPVNANSASAYQSGNSPRWTRIILPPKSLIAWISFGNLQSLITMFVFALLILFSRLAIQMSSWKCFLANSVPH